VAILIPALVLLAVIAHFASRAWLWRVRGDQIRIDAGGVRTHLATFQYDRIGHCLRLDVGGGRSTNVAVSGEARVILVPDMESALLKEALLSLVGATDLGWTDLLPRYRDQVKSVTITLDCGGKHVPIAVLSQYRAYDAYDSQGGNESIRGILSVLRVYRDVDTVAEVRGFEIADALKKQGLAVSFG